MEKITLNVKDMHCPSCEILINDSLKELDGVAIIESSHKKGTIKVCFDESIVDKDRIKTMINREGYKVE